MSPSARPRTVGAALLAAAEHARGRREGLRFVDRREATRHLPWTEVASRARRAADWLGRFGVEAGHTVVLVFGTGPEFFDAFFGVTLAGAVPVPIYPPLRFGRLDDYAARTTRMIAAAQARLVLVAPTLRERMGSIARAANARVAVLAHEDSGAFDSAPESRVDGSTGSAPMFLDPESLGLVQFSSGSTGDPRPVGLTHRALLAQAERILELLPDDPSRGLRHSGVSWLPLYHDMGLIGCVLPALRRPADLTLLAPEVFVARPSLWLQTLSRYRATVSPAPNFAFELCLERIDVDPLDRDGVDLSAWRAALVGAETVVPSILRRFAERFARFGFESRALTPVYGLAEAALAVTTTPIERPVRTMKLDRRVLTEEGRAVVGPPDRPCLEVASLGRPLPDFEVEIRSAEQGADWSTLRPLSPGRVGRVVCRGPSLMEGYLGQSAATAQVLRGGWLDTGDLGFLHEGELFLTGRANDVLVIRGRNYSPEPIEDSLGGIEGVGAVVAGSCAEDADGSEHLVVLAERRRGEGGSRPGDLELAQRCREAALTSSGLLAMTVVLLEPGCLPRTSSGKLRRGEAMRRYLECRWPAPAEVVRFEPTISRSAQS